MARKQTSLSIEQLLANSLPAISSAARQQNRLRQLLAQALCQSIPATLLNFCHLLYIGKGHISFACDNASVATQLRFHSPAILKQLNQVLRQHQQTPLNELRVKVQRADKKPPPSTVPGPTHSQGAARQLKEVADSVEDIRLSNSLTRLARHLQPRQ